MSRKKSYAHDAPRIDNPPWPVLGTGPQGARHADGPLVLRELTSTAPREKGRENRLTAGRTRAVVVKRLVAFRVCRAYRSGNNDFRSRWIERACDDNDN